MKRPTWYLPAAHFACAATMIYILWNGYDRDRTTVEQVLMLIFLSWNLSVLLKLGQTFVMQHVKIGKSK